MTLNISVTVSNELDRALKQSHGLIKRTNLPFTSLVNPNESSQQPHSLLFKIIFNDIQCILLTNGLFLSCFPIKIFTHFSSPPTSAGGDEKCATANMVQHFFLHCRVISDDSFVNHLLSSVTKSKNTDLAADCDFTAMGSCTSCKTIGLQLCVVKFDYSLGYHPKKTQVN